MSTRLLNRLLVEGLTPEIREAIAGMVEGDKSYVARAQHEWHKDGEVEIDDAAIVSECEEGAYVQAWVWVDRPGKEDS